MKRRMAPLAEERSFGRAVGGVLMLIAAYGAWRGRPTMAAVSGVTGVMLAAFGTFAPAALKWPSRAWWTLAHALGWLNTRIILTLFFVLIIVPTGLIFRLIGRDLLDLRGKGSSWLPYAARRDTTHYERMF